MTCPNCEMFVKFGTLCTYCGTDSVLLQKTVNLSDKLYNKGLLEAKSGNLSFAVESLQKSVSYNSNNTAARNLLGLVYYELGRVADACRQWIISCSHIKTDNPAQKYLNIMEENPDVFEQYAEAIQKYNNALTYLEQRNDDMAIIQLKKATELNPGFVDALNLSCLCYIISKDKQQAQKAVEKVLSIDVSNPNALSYYHILNPGRARYNPLRRRSRDIKPANYVHTKPGKLVNVFHIASAALFAAGVVLTTLFFLLAVIPQSIEDERSAAALLELRLQEQELAAEKALADKDEEIARLIEDNTRLTDEHELISTDYLRQDRINRVHSAQQLLSEGRLDEAASYIYDIDPEDLPRDIRDIYEEMANITVLPPAALLLYNGGFAAYNATDYGEARRQLERAVRYAQDGSSTKADIIYYLGLVAQAEDDSAAAVSYFMDIIENYPNANPNVIQGAEMRLVTLRGH